jgi:hypothetical protein
MTNSNVVTELKNWTVNQLNLLSSLYLEEVAFIMDKNFPNEKDLSQFSILITDPEAYPISLVPV